MSVDFEGMRKQAIYSVERMIDFFENNKNDGVITFKAEDGEELINEVLSQVRCFCYVQCSCKEVDFVKIHTVKWFN